MIEPWRRRDSSMDDLAFNRERPEEGLRAFTEAGTWGEEK
jgi:hypothetical protein